MEKAHPDVQCRRDESDMSWQALALASALMVTPLVSPGELSPATLLEVKPGPLCRRILTLVCRTLKVVLIREEFHVDTIRSVSTAVEGSLLVMTLVLCH